MLDSEENHKNAATSGSPTILRIEWGKIEVDGLGTFRDAKLYPDGGRAWDWRETNTHHVPGIQPADVQELIDNRCEVIVLTRGMQLVLQTCPETLEQLRDLSIETFVEETNCLVQKVIRVIRPANQVKKWWLGGEFRPMA